MLAAPRLLEPLGAARQGAGGAAEVVAALAVALPLVPGHLGANLIAVRRLAPEDARLAAGLLPPLAHVMTAVPRVAPAAVPGTMGPTSLPTRPLHAAKVAAGVAAVIRATAVHAVASQRTARQQARRTRGVAGLPCSLEVAEVLEERCLEL